MAYWTTVTWVRFAIWATVARKIIADFTFFNAFIHKI